jgi:hypothetical protein
VVARGYDVFEEGLVLSDDGLLQHRSVGFDRIIDYLSCWEGLFGLLALMWSDELLVALNGLVDDSSKRFHRAGKRLLMNIY